MRRGSREDGHRLAAELPRYMAAAERLEQAVGPVEIVFGHNDLLAANLIDDGTRLWLVDWEYGGFNSPLFDLGGLASNNELPPALEERLLELYFEAPVTDDLRRRYHAMKCASLLREAMWSMVSEIHLSIDVRLRSLHRRKPRSLRAGLRDALKPLSRRSGPAKEAGDVPARVNERNDQWLPRRVWSVGDPIAVLQPEPIGPHREIGPARTNPRLAGDQPKRIDQIRFQSLRAGIARHRAAVVDDGIELAAGAPRKPIAEVHRWRRAALLFPAQYFARCSRNSFALIVPSSLMLRSAASSSASSSTSSRARSSGVSDVSDAASV